LTKPLDKALLGYASPRGIEAKNTILEKIEDEDVPSLEEIRKIIALGWLVDRYPILRENVDAASYLLESYGSREELEKRIIPLTIGKESAKELRKQVFEQMAVNNHAKAKELVDALLMNPAFVKRQNNPESLLLLEVEGGKLVGGSNTDFYNKRESAELAKNTGLELCPSSVALYLVGQRRKLRRVGIRNIITDDTSSSPDDLIRLQVTPAQFEYHIKYANPLDNGSKIYLKNEDVRYIDSTTLVFCLRHKPKAETK
jgi:hypothetical protein